MEFSPGPSVDFLLNHHDFAVREFAEVSLFGDVAPDELVRVLDGPFLPCAVAVGEIDRDRRMPLAAEPFRDFEMRGELAPVVGGDGVYLVAERVQQPHDRPGRGQCLAALGQTRNLQVVGGTLDESQNGVPV